MERLPYSVQVRERYWRRIAAFDCFAAAEAYASENWKAVDLPDITGYRVILVSGGKTTVQWESK